MSLLVRGGKGREASRRRALLQPMSVVECVADIVPGRDVSRIMSVRPLRPMRGDFVAGKADCGDVSGGGAGDSASQQPA